jgi:hypothetical protein
VPEYAAAEEFARSREAFAELEEWLGGPEAAALGHAELEEELGLRGRELQRLELQAHLDLRAAREPRRGEVTGPEGIARTRAERGHRRQLSSVFGLVTVTRIAYRAPGLPNVHPADAELGLPPGRHSHGLRRKIAAEAARGSFGSAAAAVAGACGVRLGKRQCQDDARHAARDFDGFYASAGHRPPPGAAPGDVLALSCDGKGVVVLPSAMRPEQQRKSRGKSQKQDGRLSRGETRNRKRMAEVCAVYDMTPVPRTAAGILDRGPGPRQPAPRAKGKWVTAGITASAAEVVASAFAEADRRDPARERTWIALADGNPHQLARIRAEAAARDITVTIVCDFIHVTEYLWEAAWCFHPEASPAAAPWVRAHAAAVLDGRAADAAAAIRDQAAGTRLSAAKARAAAAAAAYLDSKAPYLGYPAALSNGWQISSGIIEGTCRHLVKDRMDITGARWGTETAEAILKLRALHVNGDFSAYWNYHLQQERKRNHPSYTLTA